MAEQKGVENLLFQIPVTIISRNASIPSAHRFETSKLKVGKAFFPTTSRVTGVNICVLGHILTSRTC